MKIKDDLETLIKTIENSLQEEGYLTQRFSESNKIGTTSYDGIIIKDSNGKEYLIHSDESLQYNREKGHWEETHYIEANESMKFYEFNGSKFGYYALIGAESEEKAIKFYAETVGDIEDEDSSPDEITKEQAKNRLLGICKDEQERTKANQEFKECIHQNDPYLILIDGSLL